jgi:hypothetical protein
VRCDASQAVWVLGMANIRLGRSCLGVYQFVFLVFHHYIYIHYHHEGLGQRAYLLKETVYKNIILVLVKLSFVPSHQIKQASA